MFVFKLHFNKNFITKYIFMKALLICVKIHGVNIHGASKSEQIEQFKQNDFNEKLNIIKNPFTWHWGDPCRTGTIIRYIPH